MATVDVFIVAGQSNAEGRGDSGSSPAVTAGYEADASGVTPLADPVGGADTGSAWPAFANAYYSATGIPVAIIEASEGGTALVAAADNGGGNWSPTGDLYNDMVTLVGAAMTQLDSAGHTATIRGVLWHQGERDAQAGIAAATYQDGLEQFADDVDTEWGVDLYVLRVGAPNSGDTSAWQAIRDAQDDTATTSTLVHIVYTDCVDFPGLGWMADNLHYTQTGYNDMGTTAGSIVAELVHPTPGGLVAVTTTNGAGTPITTTGITTRAVA